MPLAALWDDASGAPSFHVNGSAALVLGSLDGSLALATYKRGDNCPLSCTGRGICNTAAAFLPTCTCAPQFHAITGAACDGCGSAYYQAGGVNGSLFDCALCPKGST